MFAWLMHECHMHKNIGRLGNQEDWSILSKLTYHWPALWLSRINLQSWLWMAHHTYTTTQNNKVVFWFYLTSFTYHLLIVVKGRYCYLFAEGKSVINVFLLTQPRMLLEGRDITKGWGGKSGYPNTMQTHA